MYICSDIAGKEEEERLCMYLYVHLWRSIGGGSLAEAVGSVRFHLAARKHNIIMVNSHAIITNNYGQCACK